MKGDLNQDESKSSCSRGHVSVEHSSRISVRECLDELQGCLKCMKLQGSVI